MFDKVSKSLQGKDISTAAARMKKGWRLKSDHIQSMQNAGIDEVTVMATDNAEKMDIPNQLPEKRKRNVRTCKRRRN